MTGLRLLCYQAAVIQLYAASRLVTMGQGVPTVQLVLCARMMLLQAKP